MVVLVSLIVLLRELLVSTIFISHPYIHLHSRIMFNTLVLYGNIDHDSCIYRVDRLQLTVLRQECKHESSIK